MAISSVTKRFEINDDKTCISLAKALRESRKCIQKNPSGSFDIITSVTP